MEPTPADAPIEVAVRALALITAFTQPRPDELALLDQLVAEESAAPDPALISALSAFGGLLVRWTAEARGETPAALLARLGLAAERQRCT
ncbi:MAG: hypothetical protein ACKVWR_10730 [Acidimicrobiales bacterium]